MGSYNTARYYPRFPLDGLAVYIAYCVYERFKWEMHAKQEQLNYFNDTVFYNYVFVFFATEQVFLLIEAAPVSTPYCF